MAPAGFSAKVAGCCPMGCGETLMLGDGGHVTCSLFGCPNPTAVDHMLDVFAARRRDGENADVQVTTTDLVDGISRVHFVPADSYLLITGARREITHEQRYGNGTVILTTKLADAASGV